MEMNEFECYEDENGLRKEVLCGYNGNSKKVVIPSQFDVIEINCFYKNSDIESVEIPESVRMIKSGAFLDCPNLKMVKIPGNLYSVASDAFGDTENTAKILKTHPNYEEINGFIINKSNNCLLFAMDKTKVTYEIPENITYIGLDAFSGCTNLKTITIPENVDYLEMMSFFGCSNLETINFPKGLKYIGGAAFALCQNLKNFTLPDGIEIISIGNEILKK